jgi:hypothetical protein
MNQRVAFSVERSGTFCLLLSAFCVLSQVAAACPWCKDALQDPAQAATGARLVQGYNLTILGLMLTPLLLVAGVTALVVRSAKRTKPH